MRLRMLLLPAVASVALLAGCTGTPETPESTPTPTTNGVEALEADEILSRATDALESAESFRISGSGEAEGQTIEIDAVYAGEQLQGTFNVLGLEFEIIAVADGTYIRAGDELWTMFLPPDQAELVLPLLQGKYVKVPEEQAGSFIPSASDFTTPDGDVTKGEVDEYNGQAAIILETSDGGKMYVSLEGEPYPLAIESAEGTFEFSEFGEDANIEAPAAADVVDLETLTG